MIKNMISQMDSTKNVNFGKDRPRQMMKMRLINFQKLEYGTNIYQQHEWMFANMKPISISNHKMTLLGILTNSGLFSWIKKISLSQGIHGKI